MRGKNGNSELETARTRLANAQAEKYELKNAVLRGEYVKRSEINMAFAKVAVNIKTKLLALPPSLAVRLSKETPAVIEKILTEKIYEVLNELAEGKLV